MKKHKYSCDKKWSHDWQCGGLSYGKGKVIEED